jgi:type VI secretion system secreted protein VgrG
MNISTPLGEDATVLMEMVAHEALGQLPVFRLTLAAKRGKIKAKELLGKNITVGLEIPGGRALRYFNGYVTQFADAGACPASWFDDGDDGNAYSYVLVMHPWLWFLTRSTNCRIFQNKSVPDIIKAVCGAYPFALLDAGALSASYPAREYICQYRESDFNFLVRLMEHEGIYFSFIHDNGKHTMKLFDTRGTHEPRAGVESISFAEPSPAHAADSVDCITELYVGRALQPGSVALTDYDFMKPKVNLFSTASKKFSHDLDGFEVFDYPGEYITLGDGGNYAQIRLEELHVKHEEMAAAGFLRGIEAGRTFKLMDHPHDELNREYLVTSAMLNVTNNQPGSGGRAGSVQCDFNLIDSQTQFRPQRAITKPVVHGQQTAVVVGPAGEEIHVDEHGRVKVQFRWDRYNKADENSSCWVRVSQPWASKGWGAMFLPRVGHEVLVTFLEGDPDQPMVVGRVHNKEARTPWVLPGEKTRSGFRTRSYKGGASNFNELSFDDKQGAEEVFVQAERDKVERVKHDSFADIGNERHVTVHKDAFEEVKGDAHLKVVGDQNNEAGGSLSFKVGQDCQAKTGQKFAVDAGTEIHLKAGMKVVLEAGMSVSLKVGGNFITINPAGVFIKGSMVMINSGGDGGAGSGAAPIAPKPPKAPRSSKGGTAAAPMQPTTPAPPSPQAASLKLAWKAGAPFCAQCEAAKQAQEGGE